MSEPSQYPQCQDQSKETGDEEDLKKYKFCFFELIVSFPCVESEINK